MKGCEMIYLDTLKLISEIQDHYMLISMLLITVACKFSCSQFILTGKNGSKTCENIKENIY